MIALKPRLFCGRPYQRDCPDKRRKQGTHKHSELGGSYLLQFVKGQQANERLMVKPICFTHALQYNPVEIWLNCAEGMVPGGSPQAALLVIHSGSQWENKIGSGGFESMLRVAPPKMNSLTREWP